MRDTIQTKAYFDKGIAFKQKTIDRDKNSVDEIILHSERAGEVFRLCNRATMLCIQRYSRGDDISEMKPSVSQMVDIFELRYQTMPTLDLPRQGWEMWGNLTLSQLYDDFTCLAFVTSLRYPPDVNAKLIQSIDHAGEDGLLDRIAVRLGDTGRQAAIASKFGMEYDDLVAVIDAPAESRPAMLKTYVENWYKKHMKDMSWHGNHKGEAYVGYWCFEGALVAMLWNIDDTAIATHKHYPVDLVRYYRETGS